MKSLRALIVTVFLPVLILVIFAVSAVVAVGPAGKTTLCHFASHKFVEITVSNNALPAHLAHGDVPADQYGDCP